jgi:hypothetical protein
MAQQFVGLYRFAGHDYVLQYKLSRESEEGHEGGSFECVAGMRIRD